MYIAYFDEAGDEGYPKYSSPIFVMTAMYMSIDDWDENAEKMKAFRSVVSSKYGFGHTTEIHMAPLLTGSSPYEKLSVDQRKRVIHEAIKTIASLKVKVINIVIEKGRIAQQDYDVLGSAFGYAIQRIENDLRKKVSTSVFDIEKNRGTEIETEMAKKVPKYMLITDEGRIGKMRAIVRRMKGGNQIQSKYNPTQEIDAPLRGLIEDCLPKDSSQSHFIQAADIISYLVYMYSCRFVCDSKIEWAKRVRSIVTEDGLTNLMDLLSPVLNVDAKRDSKYGILHYPTKYRGVSKK